MQLAWPCTPFTHVSHVPALSPAGDPLSTSHALWGSARLGERATAASFLGLSADHSTCRRTRSLDRGCCVFALLFLEALRQWGPEGAAYRDALISVGTFSSMALIKDPTVKETGVVRGQVLRLSQTPPPRPCTDHKAPLHPLSHSVKPRAPGCAEVIVPIG